jgi:RNA polymerase sigma-32 factor
MLADHAQPATDVTPLQIYRFEISKYPVLKKDEEQEQTERVFNANDTKAAEKLTMSNLRLVAKVAHKYYSHYSDVLDLIQEGNIGLIHAVRKYNPHKGISFTTYASFWIRARILKHIMANWSMVKIGTTQNERRMFYGINKAKKHYLDMDEERLTGMLAETLHVREADIEQMEMRTCAHDVSLDNDSQHTYLDLYDDKENVEEIVAAKERQEVLDDTMLQFKQKLDQREKLVLENRIVSEDPWTLQQLGDEFGVSRERVRQIEEQVRRRLMNHLKRNLSRPFTLKDQNQTELAS